MKMFCSESIRRQTFMHNQKGAGLFELSVVVLVLGWMMYMGFSYLFGEPSDRTKAKAMVKVATGLADNWSLLARECGVSRIFDSTTNAHSVMNLLLGSATVPDVITAGVRGISQDCFDTSGVRSLKGLTVASGSGVAATHTYDRFEIRMGSVPDQARHVVVSFSDVPEELVKLLNHEILSREALETGLSGWPFETSRALQYSTVSDENTRTVFLVRPL